MKVVSAQARLHRLAFARPVVTSRGAVAARGTVILELRDADGRVGYGEASSWPGFATESATEALAALETVCRFIDGAEVVPGEAFPPRMAALLSDAPSGRAALQGAVWDLAARMAGLPLADCLAAHRVPAATALRDVRANALLLERSPEALRAEASNARAAGYRAAKIKLGGGSLAEDLQRARAAREGLGPDVRLRGDANGAWTGHEARAALQALEEFDFDYVEQPVAPGDAAALASLRGRASVRIAVDESVATEDGALRLLEAGAADVYVLKPAFLGGPARALEVAERIRQAGCDVVFTHSLESAVGARHVLHCAAAWGDPVIAHGLGTAGLFVTDIAEPVAVHDGIARVTGGPGLGIEP